MPINYAGIMQDLKRGLLAQKKEILQGLTWRIIKSKSKTVRKQNIVGLFLNDTLGILTGDAS